MTRSIDIQQSLLAGLSPEEAYKKYQQEVEDTMKVCKFFHAAVGETNRALELTKREMKKLQ